MEDNVRLSAMRGELDATYASVPGWQSEVDHASLGALQACFAKTAVQRVILDQSSGLGKRVGVSTPETRYTANRLQ